MTTSPLLDKGTHLTGLGSVHVVNIRFTTNRASKKEVEFAGGRFVTNMVQDSFTGVKEFETNRAVDVTPNISSPNALQTMDLEAVQ